MFGERLRRLRKERKMTLQELADYLKLAKSTISQYETGKNEPDLDTIQKLTDFFGVSIDFMVGRVDNPKSVLTEAERELYDNIDLNDEIILEKFKLVVDGKPVTEQEAKDFIAFVRARRSMQK